jgi:GTP-binding protein
LSGLFHFEVRMKFVDEAFIDIAAGDGGNGCVSFRHEKYKEFGGPTAATAARRPRLGGGGPEPEHAGRLPLLAPPRGGRGEHGMGSDMFGAMGHDITLKMPVGTIITDAETGEVLYELLQPARRS